MGAVAGAMLLIGMSGAIAALGDTLFPVDSFVEGLERELSASGHVFERLRIYHPILAVTGGLLAVWVANRLGETRPGRVERTARLVAILVLVQLAFGTVNALLAAPVWMQIVHLLLADLVWMTLVVLAADVLQPARTRARA